MKYAHRWARLGTLIAVSCTVHQPLAAASLPPSGRALSVENMVEPKRQQWADIASDFCQGRGLALFCPEAFTAVYRQATLMATRAARISCIELDRERGRPHSNMGPYDFLAEIKDFEDMVYRTKLSPFLYPYGKEVVIKLNRVRLESPCDAFARTLDALLKVKADGELTGKSAETATVLLRVLLGWTRLQMRCTWRLVGAYFPDYPEQSNGRQKECLDYTVSLYHHLPGIEEKKDTNRAMIMRTIDAAQVVQTACIRGFNVPPWLQEDEQQEEENQEVVKKRLCDGMRILSENSDPEAQELYLFVLHHLSFYTYSPPDQIPLQQPRIVIKGELEAMDQQIGDRCVLEAGLPAAVWGIIAGYLVPVELPWEIRLTQADYGALATWSDISPAEYPAECLRRLSKLRGGEKLSAYTFLTEDQWALPRWLTSGKIASSAATLSSAWQQERDLHGSCCGCAPGSLGGL